MGLFPMNVGGGGTISYVTYKDLNNSTVTLDGTYSGKYLLISTVQSGQQSISNAPTVTNGTVQFTRNEPVTLIGGNYMSQGYSFIELTNGTITSNATNADIRHHNAILFKIDD